MKVYITGYDREGYCDHCGRPLVHVVRLSDGRGVGATCFAKKLVKPRRYNGKLNREHPSSILDLARAMEFWDETRRQRAGYQHWHFEFEYEEE